MILNMGKDIVCSETYGSGEPREYAASASGKLVIVSQQKQWTSISETVRAIFLPQGYPDSVSDDYLEYQIWDTIQAFASYTTGSLASHATLKAIGVGDDSATALAAAMTYIIKDGTGMAGRIIFAWLKGTSLDCDAKRWRLFADCLNDAAMCIKIAAPMFKPVVTPVICLAGVCLSIVGVAGGATRAALTQHQARRNNMADVSAKDGSQETLVNLLGILFGLILLPTVTASQPLVWLFFTVFTTLHVYANYRAVSAVKMETLNQTRLLTVVRESVLRGRCASVTYANHVEPVLFEIQRRYKVRLGCRLSQLTKSASELEWLEQVYGGEQYMLNLDRAHGRANVALRRGAEALDCLKACVQSDIIDIAKSADSLRESPYEQEMLSIRNANTADTVSESLALTKRLFQPLVDDVERAGWVTSYFLLGPDEYRMHVTHPKSL